MFDGYAGVDSGTTTAATAPTATQPVQSGEAHWEYSQSTGQLWKVAADGTKTLAGSGYSGDSSHYNDPNSENLQKQGPIPKGEYTLTAIDNHKGPETITLSPSTANNMYDRNGFLIHGDNSSMNHTASEGCIIMPKAVRDELACTLITKLIV